MDTYQIDLLKRTIDNLDQNDQLKVLEIASDIQQSPNLAMSKAFVFGVLLLYTNYRYLKEYKQFSKIKALFGALLINIIIGVIFNILPKSISINIIYIIIKYWFIVIPLLIGVHYYLFYWLPKLPKNI